MDAACSALRLGAKKVSIVYRRSAAELPALKEEIDYAVEEGVDFQFLANPVEFIGDKNNRLHSVKCIRMELGEPDESGRRRPVPVKGSEFEIAADTVILAIGSRPGPSLAEAAPELAVGGRTNMPRIMATISEAM